MRQVMNEAQKTKTKVPFTRANFNLCLCGDCPVQAKSACVKANSDKLGDIDTTRFFQPKVVPGLYCSSGAAACKDIDTNQACICGGCEVYGNYYLDKGEPTTHYCKNGLAK